MSLRRRRLVVGACVLTAGAAAGLWRVGMPEAQQESPAAPALTQADLQRLEEEIDAITADQQAILDRLENALQETALIKTRAMRRRVP